MARTSGDTSSGPRRNVPGESALRHATSWSRSARAASDAADVGFSSRFVCSSTVESNSWKCSAELTAEHFQLFDSTVDEHTNLLEKPTSAASEAARALRDQLVAWRRALSPGTFRLGPDDVSPEVRAMLQARGYWDPN